MRKIRSMHKRSRVYSLLAAVLALVLSFGFVTANADEEYPPGYPKLGTWNEFTRGHLVQLDTMRVKPTLFTVHTDGSNGMIKAYCIEIEELAKPGVTLEVQGWDEFPGDNNFKDNPEVQAKVAWIVARSYPENELSEVADRAGVAGLTEQEAITATQTAMWHFTNDVNYKGLLQDNNQPYDSSSPEAMRVQKLYDYLIGDENVGVSESSGPTVAATGPAAPGTAGEPVGPIRIESSAATAKVSGAPYALVDEDGNVLDPAAVPTGKDLFLEVPADADAGNADLVIEVSGSKYTGKLLTSVNPRSQTIMITGYQPVTSETQLQVNWKQAPPPPAAPTPTPTPTPTPSPSPVPSPSPTPSPSPVPSPSPTPTLSPSPVPSPTPSDHPTIIVPRPGVPETGC